MLAQGPISAQLLTGNVISSHGNDPTNAFDGNPSTYFQAYGHEMRWVGLELPDTTYVIKRIGFRPVATSQGQDNMQLSIFEGANRPDFMDAVPLYLIPNKPAKNQMTYVDINVTRAFRYVRYVGSSGSYCRVADLEFYGYPGEGSDEQFYQITKLPTVSIHVENEANPQQKGEDFNAYMVNIFDGGKQIQDHSITTHVRGNYSSTHENKPFRVKFENKHRMLNGGVNESPTKAKKWVLINSYRDKTLLRNPIGFAVSKRVGPTFVPWSQPVDLILNGDYHGTYTLADHVSVGKGRIDIEEMDADDVAGDSLTGGYFFEADNNYGGEMFHWMSAFGNTMSMHSPDDDVAQGAQFNYLRQFFDEFENRLYGSQYLDTTSGYRSRMDVESFVKWFLTSELTGNTDMICQVFMYKHRGDNHIYTGPVWDHDLALENDITTYPANQREDWTYPVRQTGRWGDVVSRVLSDSRTMARLQELWAQLRDDSVFTSAAMEAMVDSFRVQTKESAELNFLRWPYLLQELSLNPRVWGSWEAEVDNVKNYLSGRVAWMDKKLRYSDLEIVNGVYQISSAHDFCKFLDIVRQGKYDARCKLLADIDMTHYNNKFKPVGTSVNPFVGTIDGGGHTIDNLRYKGADNVGIIAYSGANCTIQKLTLGSGCRMEGNNNVAAFVGEARGTLNITECGFEGSVEATEVGAAAFVGTVRRTITARLTDCYNAGSIKANNRAASLVAPCLGRTACTKCFNCGPIVGAEAGHEFAFGEGRSAITTCYDTQFSTQATALSTDSVQNGWLTCALNGDRKIWYQNIDNGSRRDYHPVLSNTHGFVYFEDGRYTNLRQFKGVYTYYRLEVTQVGSEVMQLAEVAFLNESFSELPVSIYEGANGFFNEGYPNLCDRNLDTKFCGSVKGTLNFFFELNEPTNIYGYRLYTAGDTNNYPERNPRSWTLYGSNTFTDNPADPSWEVIDEQIYDTKLGATSKHPYDYVLRTPQPKMTLDRHVLRMNPEDMRQLTLDVQPKELFGSARVAWKSTNEQVAIVSDGLVQAIGVGETYIIASLPDYGNVADTCLLMVTEGAVGYQYFLLEIERLQDGNTAQLSEFDLMIDEQGTTPKLVMYGFESNYVAHHPPYDMVDDNTSTKFCGTPLADNHPFRFYVKTEGPILPVAYRMTTANDTKTYSGRNPLTWRLYGSNVETIESSSDDWVLLDERIEDYTMGASNYTPYDFNIDHSTSIDVPSAKSEVSTDAIYDLQGRRVSNPRRGIYIVNGKLNVLK